MEIAVLSSLIGSIIGNLKGISELITHFSRLKGLKQEPTIYDHLNKKLPATKKLIEIDQFLTLSKPIAISLLYSYVIKYCIFLLLPILLSFLLPALLFNLFADFLNANLYWVATISIVVFMAYGTTFYQTEYYIRIKKELKKINVRNLQIQFDKQTLEESEFLSAYFSLYRIKMAYLSIVLSSEANQLSRKMEEQIFNALDFAEVIYPKVLQLIKNEKLSMSKNTRKAQLKSIIEAQIFGKLKFLVSDDFYNEDFYSIYEAKGDYGVRDKVQRYIKEI